MPSPLQYIDRGNKVQQEYQESVQQFYTWYALQHSKVGVRNNQWSRLLAKECLVDIVLIDVAHDDDLVACDRRHVFGRERQCFTEVPDEHLAVVDMRLSHRQVY